MLAGLPGCNPIRQVGWIGPSANRALVLAGMLRACLAAATAVVTSSALAPGWLGTRAG